MYSASTNALSGEVVGVCRVSFVVEMRSVCFDCCSTSLISDRLSFGLLLYKVVFRLTGLAALVYTSVGFQLGVSVWELNVN